MSENQSAMYVSLPVSDAQNGLTCSIKQSNINDKMIESTIKNKNISKLPSPVTDLGFPRRGGGGRQLPKLRCQPIIWQIFS